MPLRPPARATPRLCLLTPAALLALLPAAGCRRDDRGRYTVGFAQMESNNPWRLAQTASLRAEAARRGYRLVVTDALGQTAKQVNDVEDLIARRVRVILLAPREYRGLAPALEAAREAHIPVVLVDRQAAGVPGRDYVTFLGSNFVEQGRRAAEWLARATDGRATVVELTGTPGSSVATDRARGFREELARHPGMRVVASQTGDFSRARGQQVMRNLAQSLGAGFTAVYAHNDEMALGAIEALRAAGRAPGRDVLVVSIDGERAALEAIGRGELGATVESNPRFGPLAFETVEQLRRGERVPPAKLITDRFFDRANAARFVAEAY